MKNLQEPRPPLYQSCEIALLMKTNTFHCSTQNSTKRKIANSNSGNGRTLQKRLRQKSPFHLSSALAATSTIPQTRIPDFRHSKINSRNKRKRMRQKFLFHTYSTGALPPTSQTPETVPLFSHILPAMSIFDRTKQQQRERTEEQATEMKEPLRQQCNNDACSNLSQDTQKHCRAFTRFACYV